MDKPCNPQVTLICPICGGRVPDDSTVCPDCHEDLAGLAGMERRHAILYNEALALARQDRLAEARDKLIAALTLEPGFCQGHALLAKVHAHRTEWPEAQARIEQALALAPDDAHLAALAEGIEAEARQAEISRAEAAQPPEPPRAEGQNQVVQRRALAMYERDIAAAFALGLGLASTAALLASWVRGRLSRRG
jgi:tetratricopeptide (TPR) repeat protein